MFSELGGIFANAAAISSHPDDGLLDVEILVGFAICFYHEIYCFSGLTRASRHFKLSDGDGKVQGKGQSENW